jgi:hypothetical protein
MVERAGETFCCNNCAATRMIQSSQAALGTCAHCHVPIVDPSTKVDRDGMAFCCNNCATTMTAGAGQRQP